MASNTVAISSDFLTSFSALPRRIQQKTSTFINKFRADPTSPGIHYEKIGSSDNKIYSVRIDDTYRGIVARQHETGTYLLLWVDHHDEAYEWARRRKCTVNALTGSLQVYEVVEEPIASPPQQSGNAETLFSSVTDDQLLRIGVPEDQLQLVRSFIVEADLDRAATSLPADALEGLMWLANGFSFDEVMEVLHDDGQKTTATDDISEALQNHASQRSFVVVDGEDELFRLLSAPLEKWRTFLHPSQRSIVEKRYNGPARILGGAGTGKTVVAMHRARTLAKACPPDERILFTTFSTNLASDIQASLKKLCSVEELRRIEVINLDAWVARFLSSQGFEYRISYDLRELEGIWQDAIAEAGCNLDLEPSFYVDEWAQIILALDELTLENYVHAKRTGRGNRLRRKDRIAIWEVTDCYRRLMRERGVRDVDSGMRDARLVLEQNPGDAPYRSLVVDEGQDFSAPAYRLIRALAGPEHSDDLFIVGDAHQRIYGKRAVLSRCGINIRGRSRKLRINYRTPEEIRKAAVAVIAGLSWDDLDDGIDDDEVTQSLVYGTRPETKTFRDITAEIDWIESKVRQEIASGRDPKDICVVLRTNSLASEYARGLSERGLVTMLLKPRQVDDRSKDGVRLATMHRVKGLEFDVILLANMSRGVVPLDSALRRARREGNEEDVIQAERSLVYVAMTRAKRSTTITAVGTLSPLISEH